MREEGFVDGIEDTWKDDGEIIGNDINEFEKELEDDLPSSPFRFWSNGWWD